MNMLSSAHYSATLYNGRNAEAVPVGLVLGADSLRVVGPIGVA